MCCFTEGVRLRAKEPMVTCANTTTVYTVGEGKTVTKLGLYERAYEARNDCEAMSKRKLKWIKRFDGIWEAKSDTGFYRLITTRG